MSKLSARHLTELGDCFLAIAQSVGNYRMENRILLSKSQNQLIKDLHWSLLNYADDFYTTSAKLVMDEVQESLYRIKQVSTKINTTYQRLKNFQKAIDIAAAAITLGASIFSKNPMAINDAITKFAGEIG